MSRGASSLEVALCLVSRVGNYSRLRQSSLISCPISFQKNPPFASRESRSDIVSEFCGSPGRCVQPDTIKLCLTHHLKYHLLISLFAKDIMKLKYLLHLCLLYTTNA
ncbi:hypothetical protein M758_9G003100 [Ceratodon purpureus]|nr:hypothetical protein M758_9G003100 [Ceratodon purpureus]